MSLESFLGLLRTADQIDRESVPVHRPGLLRSGITLSAIGALAAIIAYVASAGCVTVVFLLVVSAGLILLLAYALEAKLYGRIAAGLVVLFLGSCFAIPVLLRPHPSQVEVAPRVPKQSTNPTSATVAGSVATPVEPVLPPKPTVPRILETKVPRLPQVYADQTTRLVHSKACPLRTSQMLRMPRAVAGLQGYTPHDGCARLQSELDYIVERTVHPEWVAYEQQVAALGASSPNPAPPVPTTPPDASTSSPRKNRGDVQVRGYYRKDGTYVAPHNRSRPKK